MINKIKIQTMIVCLFMLVNTLQAQKAFYEDYTWDKSPNISIFKTDEKEDLICFKDKVVSEFVFLKESTLIEYYIEHKIMWLNSDDKIEGYNKIYLPYDSSSELIKSKARVISKKGEIIELDDSKILTATNEENKSTYKYFALEGVEKGSFIEYYYILKRVPRYRGSKLFFQNTYQSNNVSFDLIAPLNLIFKFKSYNQAAEMVLDTLVKDKLHWKLLSESVPKLDKEASAPYNTLRQQIVYKLDRNSYSKTYDITSYRNVATGIYDFYFKEISKKEISLIQKLVSKIDIPKNANDATKIRKTENYLKSNFYIVEHVDSDQLSDIKSIVDSKTASESGIIKIYINVLQQLGIKTEIVLTSDRTETKFDPDFEANNFLTDILMYFPSVNSFTSAIDLGSRLGFPPSQFTNNYGLFVKEIAVGTYKNGVGEIRYIPTPKASQTVDDMKLNVRFDPSDFTKNSIDFDLKYTGYQALYVQPFLPLMDEDSKSKIIERFIKSTDESIVVKEKKIVNDAIDLFGTKPLEIQAKAESTAFVNKAGNKYLFSLGKLIGPQMEMYQEKERKTPYESDNTRTYKREIYITIPEGFTFTNLSDINISNHHEVEGKKVMGFHSYYELNGDQLKVVADEFYDEVIIAPSLFEVYRKIINNAADFNKIILVLQPK